MKDKNLSNSYDKAFKILSGGQERVVMREAYSNGERMGVKTYRDAILSSHNEFNRESVNSLIDSIVSPYQHTNEEKVGAFLDWINKNPEIFQVNNYTSFTNGDYVIAQKMIKPIISMALAENPWTEFAQIIPMKDGDHPVYALRSAEERNIYVISEHATPMKANTFKQKDSHVYIDPYVLTSDWNVIPDYSPAYPGMYLQELEDTKNMTAYSFKKKVSKDCKALLDATLTASWDSGTFTFKDDDLESFPEGNIIAPSDGEGIDKNMFAEVFAHFSSFDHIKVVEFLVNKDDLKNFWVNSVDVTTSTSDAVENWDSATASRIVQTGTLTQLFGHNFRIRTVNTIPSGTVYVKTNRPAMLLWYYSSVGGPNGSVDMKIDTVNPTERKMMRIKSHLAMAAPHPLAPNYAVVNLASE
jgi:hypothetical protein